MHLKPKYEKRDRSIHRDAHARCLLSFKGLDPRQKPHMSHGFDTSSLPSLLQFSETQWSHVKSPTLRHRFESLLPWRHSILYFYVHVLNFCKKNKTRLVWPRVLDHSPSALHASSGSASHKRRKAKPVEVNRLVTDQSPKNLEPKTAQISAVAGKLT